MENWIPLDVFHLMLDLLPHATRGRTILASAGLHRALASDVKFWNRIWDDTGFYLQPRDLLHPPDESLASHASRIRVGLTKCTRAVSALSKPNALENFRFRKILGVPGWIPAGNRDDEVHLALSLYNKKSAFYVGVKKSTNIGSYSQQHDVDDLFCDVSQIRITADLGEIPVVSIQELKKSEGLIEGQTQVLPAADGFLLRHQRSGGAPLSKNPGNSSGAAVSSWRTYRSGPTRRPSSLPSPSAPIVLESGTPNLPLAFQRIDLSGDSETVSLSGLIVQLFAYVDAGAFRLGSFPCPLAYSEPMLFLSFVRQPSADLCYGHRRGDRFGRVYGMPTWSTSGVPSILSTTLSRTIKLTPKDVR